jgi:hypothetical protein
MDTDRRDAAPGEPGGVSGDRGAPVRPWHSRRALAVGAVALVTVTAGLVAAWTAATGGGQEKLTDTGVASCASHIAEGVVTTVSPSRAGGWQVTVQVETSLKGAGVGQPLTYRDDDPPGPRRGPGTRVFVIISRFPGEPVQEFVGADVAWARDWMARAVPLSHDVPCDGPG